MNKLLTLIGLLSVLAGCATGSTPFDASRTATDDISNTLQSLNNDRQALLTFGANWCSDSRALASAYAAEPLKGLLADNFDIVFIDIGERNRNLEVAEKFNAPVMGGIPSIAIVDKNGAINFSSKAEDLKHAAKMTEQDIYDYFENLTR